MNVVVTCGACAQAYRMPAGAQVVEPAGEVRELATVTIAQNARGRDRGAAGDGPAPAAPDVDERQLQRAPLDPPPAPPATTGVPAKESGSRGGASLLRNRRGART